MKDELKIAAMKGTAAEILKKYLQQDEILLWAGQPKKGIAFEGTDFFSTIKFIVASCVLYILIKSMAEVSVFFAVFTSIFFMTAFLVLGIARFFIDAELRKHTFYGLTEKRIIIVSAKFPKKIQLIDLTPKTKILLLPNFDGTVTIDIGLKEPGTLWAPNSKGYSYLYRLSDGQLVYKKLKEIIVTMKNTNNPLRNI